MPLPSIILEHPAPGVVRIILNRPKALNALNVDLLDGLVRALRENGQARVIILEGAGDRSFCAGEDLKQTLAPKTGSGQELRQAFHKLQDVTRLTSSSQVVVIAAVQGFAIGGGAEIALAADFIIGGPAAKYRFPEVSLGHAATGGITLRLPHLIGLLKAKELLLTGRWVESSEAFGIGLLSEIHQDPKQRALELALELAQLPGTSLASSKASLERALFPNMEGCLQDEVNVASHCFAQSDASKGYSDFAARKSKINEVSNLNTNGVSSFKTPDKGSGIPTTARPLHVTPEHSNIRDINTALVRAARSFPEQVFLRFAGKEITFGQFNTSVSRLAGGLRQLGVGPGDRVLVMMVNSPEMVCSWMAVNRLGAAWVPVNTELKSVTLQHVIEAAAPKLAIVDAALWPAFESVNVVDSSSVIIHGKSHNSITTFLSLLDSDSKIDEPAMVGPTTTSAFLYTSGTTGRSKPCAVSHEYFLLQARTLIDSLGLTKEDVLYSPFPLFHIDSTALTTIPAILLGAVAALSARYSASGFWDEIRAFKATVYNFMGATLALTYKQPPTPRDQEHGVRLAWGVPIPSFAREYEERFGHPLIALYGSVEAGIPIFQDRSRKLPAGSCGRLRPGYELRIANDADEELPRNTTGNLLLRNDQPNAFFQGYYGDRASTLAAFRGLWLHTGDLARMDEDGNVYFAGRIKDVVRRRGENINASEVEEEFLQHPDVLIAAAFGVPSDLGAGTEDDLKVAVHVRAGSTTTAEELWEWSVGRMARFQVPSIIEIVDGFRQTPTGKVAKEHLKAEGGQRFDIRGIKGQRVSV